MSPSFLPASFLLFIPATGCMAMMASFSPQARKPPPASPLKMSQMEIWLSQTNSLPLSMPASHET